MTDDEITPEIERMAEIASNILCNLTEPIDPSPEADLWLARELLKRAEARARGKGIVTDTPLYLDAVERMAAASFEEYTGGEPTWADCPSEKREMWLEQEEAPLAALLALLAERRIRFAPEEATAIMGDHGGEAIVAEYARSDWKEAEEMAENLSPDAIYDAMIRAYPNPLKPEEPK